MLAVPWGIALWVADLAAPFVAFAFLAFVSAFRKWPIWKAFGVTSMAYFVWANTVRWIIIPSLSVFLLMQGTHLALMPWGMTVGSLETAHAQALITVIPVVAYCIVPTALIRWVTRGR